MPICHRKKIIFIHIPKTAGESIEKSLGIYGGLRKWSIKRPLKGRRPGRDEALKLLWGNIDGRTVLQHLTAAEVKNIVSEDVWASYFKFAVVRNPWSKAVSEYNWYLRYGPNCSFEEWVGTLHNRIPINRAISRLEIGHNICQCSYLYDHAERPLVDEILRFENIQEEFSRLSRVRNWDVELIFDSATSSRDKRDFRSYYNERTIEEIERIYIRDVRKFQYSREETFQ